MAGWTDAEEAKLLDHWTGKTAYAIVTWYVGLSTTTPTETGTNITEPSNGGYIRQALTAATWTAASAGDPSSTSYGGTVTFPVATGGWGTITHFVLYTVATQGTGTARFWGTLTAAKAVQTSDQLTAAANTLFVKLGDPSDVY